MMAVAIRIKLRGFAFVTFGCVVALIASAVVAQPLVNGGLVVYYDFDNFTDTVMDGSGNGFNGKVQDSTRNVLDQPFTLNTTGVISNDHSEFKRGGGAIRFTHSTVAGEDPVFVDMDGGVISAAQPAIMPSATNAVSFAAWVNATDYTGDFTVFQGASGGHGVPHFQIQSGTGQIRFVIRNSTGKSLVDSGNAAGTSAGHPYPNQPDINSSGATPMPFPLNEWHHVAVTYDFNGDWDGPGPLTGHLDMFYDGVKIKSMGMVPAGPGPIGNWQLRAFSDFYDGLGMGAVYDSGSRRTRGLLDEAYIFNRKLSDAEVFTLYNIAPPGVAGDYNGNGEVDAADYVLWRKGGPLQNEVDTPGTVNAADYTAWRSRFGNTSSSGLGNAAAVPEPASLGLLLVCLSILAGRRHRGR